MTDPRYKKLATLLVGYSTELKKGDRVLLDMIDVPDEFTIELMRAARKAGAIPIVEVRHTRVTREVIRGQRRMAHSGTAACTPMSSATSIRRPDRSRNIL